MRHFTYDINSPLEDEGDIAMPAKGATKDEILAWHNQQVNLIKNRKLGPVVPRMREQNPEIHDSYFALCGDPRYPGQEKRKPKWTP